MTDPEKKLISGIGEAIAVVIKAILVAKEALGDNKSRMLQYEFRLALHNFDKNDATF